MKITIKNANLLYLHCGFPFLKRYFSIKNATAAATKNIAIFTKSGDLPKTPL
jgi:hypothetical protein